MNNTNSVHNQNQNNEELESDSQHSSKSSKLNFALNDDLSLSGSSVAGTSLASSRHTSTLSADDDIAKRETKAVAYSRALVIIVLVLAAAASGVATWFYSSQAANDYFQSQVCVLFLPQG